MPRKLALVLIARNESRCLARCLTSVRPWVDHLLVLDTGSTDDTADIAASCGAEVHHWAWRDDFAAARNHALDLADADWHLVLDADEWIAGGGDSLRELIQGPPFLGVAQVCSAFDTDTPDPSRGGTNALHHSHSWISRLLPRGVRYTGRVHEQAVSDLPRRRIPVQIGHDGYRRQHLQAKQGRNRDLLDKDLRDHPDDPYLLYQRGKEAEIRDRFTQACDWYARAAEHTPSAANWSHDLLIRRLHCLEQTGRTAEGLALAESVLGTWADSPDFFFTLGNLLLTHACKEPARAVEHWLPLAETAWLRCLELGERPDLEGSVAGRGSHLARHNLDVLRGHIR